MRVKMENMWKTCDGTDKDFNGRGDVPFVLRTARRRKYDDFY